MEPSSNQDRHSDPVPAREQPVLDLEALRARDDAAWTTAFKKLWPVAFHVAKRYLRSDRDAEEAASDTLKQMVFQIAYLKTIDDLFALTRTIAERRAVSFIRRNSAAKRTADMVSLDDDSSDRDPLIERLPAPEGTLSTVESAEQITLLQQALSELDRLTRQLLEEKIIQGHTYEVLSARHGIPLGTVCAKVARGLKKLRAIIENSPILKKELRGFLR